MPQRSYNYAVGRVKALEARMMDPAKLRRLATAEMSDFLKALYEIGYGDCNLPCQDAFEELLKKEMREVRQLIWAITPEPEVTGLFLLPVDARNLKVLFKARLQNIDPSGLLEEGGLFPTALLFKAVGEKSYWVLPKPFKNSLDELEKQLARAVSPQLVSVRVDGAVFSYVESVLANKKNAYACHYFSLLADFSNLRTLLRARALRWESDAFSSLLVACGGVSRQTFLQAFALPDEQLVSALSRGANAVPLCEVLTEYLSKNSVSALETKAEALLMRFVLRRRSDFTDIGPIIHYLLGKEAEAKSLGIIFAALIGGTIADLPEF